MDIIPGVEAIPEKMGPTVVTIGMFDGVHRGHRKIIHIAHERARELGLRCVVFTFDRHPLEVIDPGKHPKLLSSSAQKMRLLEELDVDTILMAHFDEEFSRIPAHGFVEDLLIGRLKAKEIVLGENFRFGRGGGGDVEFLRNFESSLEIKVIAISLLRDNGDVISSTLIRALIEKGEVEEAGERLGWDYMIEGVVVKGDARGRKLGFPTANVEVHDNRCIPLKGVYSGEAHLEHHTMPAVTYIGDIPTFIDSGAGKQRIEVHIPEWGEELYHHYLGISFKRRLREEATFDDAAALSEQIRKDVKQALGDSEP